jgi:hypothetical protein
MTAEVPAELAAYVAQGSEAVVQTFSLPTTFMGPPSHRAASIGSSRLN